MAALRMLAQTLAVCLGMLCAMPVLALDKPSGDIVLTVRGHVATPNAGRDAVFDMQLLQRLPQHSFTTRSPWYAETVQFTGPLLRDVLAAAGAKGSKLVATALNDYRTEIPFSDAERHDVIVARLLNGKPMSVREKGPLFIVYPFDSKAELKAEVYYNRSAWQLMLLQVQ